jgi:hypothetical protein
MGTAFWIRRFLVVLGVAFVIIAGSQLLRGRTTEDSVLHGLLWSVISAAIFTVVNIYRWRRGQQCALCVDAPDPKPADPGGRPT